MNAEKGRRGRIHESSLRLRGRWRESRLAVVLMDSIKYLARTHSISLPTPAPALASSPLRPGWQLPAPAIGSRHRAISPNGLARCGRPPFFFSVLPGALTSTRVEKQEGPPSRLPSPPVLISARRRCSFLRRKHHCPALASCLRLCRYPAMAVLTATQRQQ